MIIPIPARQRRFRLHLALHILKPCSIRILAYDPTRPHSDYERKRVQFTKATKWQKTLNFPVSPNLLYLDLFSQTGNNQDFHIEDVKVEPLAGDVIWSNPDQQQFMDFAMSFAKKLGSKKVGFYNSPDQEYLFQLLDTIRDQSGNELPTPARISRVMPRVQLSKKHFQRYTIPVRIAVLAHEGCHWFLNTRSQKEADLCGLKYILDYGFTKKQAHASVDLFDQKPKGFSLFVNDSPTSRVGVARNFIDQYQPLSIAA